MTISKKDFATQTGKLFEALVEGRNLKTGGNRKCCQVCVVPNVRGEPRELCELPPYRFHPRGLVYECNSWIGNDDIVQFSSLVLSHCSLRKDVGIVRQSQKTLLSEPAEVTQATRRQFVKPSPRWLVVLVRGKRQSQPDVYVRKVHSPFPSWRQHLPLQIFRLCPHLSGERCQALPPEPRVTRRGSRLSVALEPETRKPSSLPRMSPRQAQRHRFECGQKVPCPYYRPPLMQIQAVLRCGGRGP